MSKSAACTLKASGPDDLRTLMTWFSAPDQVIEWAGPGVCYPWTETSFLNDIRVGELASLSLFEQGRMAGFGQYYDRLGYCHMGRLVIAPTHRGQGLGGRLVRALAEEGCRALGTSECSLFVLERNRTARNCYLRMGFETASWPDPEWLESVMPVETYGACLYLRCSLERLRSE